MGCYGVSAMRRILPPVSDPQPSVWYTSARVSELIKLPYRLTNQQASGTSTSTTCTPPNIDMLVSCVHAVHNDDNKNNKIIIIPTRTHTHSLAGNRNAYTCICTELASHGYVVLALEHADGSASAARLAGSMKVPQRPATGGPAPTRLPEGG
jgi:hypothetical protein